MLKRETSKLYIVALRRASTPQHGVWHADSIHGKTRQLLQHLARLKQVMQAGGRPSARKVCCDPAPYAYDQSVKCAADLERKCRATDRRALFSGPQKHIQELWTLIEMQKMRIEHLEQYLLALAAEGKPLEMPIVLPEQTQPEQLCVQLVGGVLGHEERVFTALQHYLHQDVNLTKLPKNHNEHKAVTLKFHRMKSRLPAEDLGAIASDEGNQGRLIVIFMHDIASGHEGSLKPAGPSNTDPGCWQLFKQQCLLVTDMAFDETCFELHSINKNAISTVAKTLSYIAHQEADQSSHD